MAGKTIDYTIRASLIVDPQKAAGGAGGKSTSARAGLLQGDFSKALKPMVDTLNGTVGNINKHITEFNLAIQNATKRYTANNAKTLTDARLNLASSGIDPAKFKADMATLFVQTMTGKVKNSKLDLSTVALDENKLKVLQKQFDNITGAESINFIKEYRRVLKAVNKISLDFASIATDAESQERALQTEKTSRRKAKAMGAPIPASVGPTPPSLAIATPGLGVVNNLSGAASSLNQAANNLNKTTSALPTVGASTTTGYKASLNSIISNVTGPGGFESNLQSVINSFNTKTPSGISKQDYYIKKLNAVLSNPDLKTGDIDALRTNDKVFASIELEIKSIIDFKKNIESQLNRAKKQFGGITPPELMSADALAKNINISALQDKTGDALNKTEAENIKIIAAEKARLAEEEAKRQRDVTNALKEQQTQQQKLLQQNIKKLDQTTKIGDALKKVAKYTLAAFSIYSIQYGIRKVATYLTDLDKAMTNIGVVTGYTRKELQAMTMQMNQLASSLGRTTKEVAEASLLFYQQGKSTAEVNLLVEATVKSAAIAMIDMKEASSQLTAALNGYGLAATDAMRIADVFAKLGAMSAADFSELSAALTKTASQSKTVGMSIETTTAFLAKMIEVTRESPENLGTAWKTITARYAQFNKDPNLMVDDEPINKVGAALNAVGIEVLDLNGELRDFDDVILELGAKWEGLNRNTKQYLATALAGSRQQSRFLALMNDFDRTLQLVAAAENAAGDANVQYNRHMQGMEAALNKVQVAIEKWQLSLINSGFLINLVNQGEAFISVLSKIPGYLQLIMVAVVALTAKMTSFSKSLALMAIDPTQAMNLLQKMQTGGTLSSFAQKNILFRKDYQSYNQARTSLEAISSIDTSVVQLNKNGKILSNNAIKVDGLVKEVQVALKDSPEALTEFNNSLVDSKGNFKNSTDQFHAVQSQLTKSTENYKKQVDKAASNLGTSAAKLTSVLQASSIAVVSAIGAFSSGAAGDALGGFTSGLGLAISGAMIGATTGAKAGGAWGALAGGLSGLILYFVGEIVNKSANELKKLKEDLTKETATLDTLKRETESISTLYTEYTKLSKIMNKNTTEIERFKTIQDELVSSVPGLITGYDAVGERILLNAELIDKVLADREQRTNEQKKIVKSKEIQVAQAELIKEAPSDIRAIMDELAVANNTFTGNAYMYLASEHPGLTAENLKKLKDYQYELKKAMSQIVLLWQDFFLLESKIILSGLNKSSDEINKIQLTTQSMLTNVLEVVLNSLEFQSQSKEEQTAIQNNIMKLFTSSDFLNNPQFIDMLSGKKQITNQGQQAILDYLVNKLTEVSRISSDDIAIVLNEAIITVEEQLTKLNLLKEDNETSIGTIGQILKDNSDTYEQAINNLTIMSQTLSDADKQILTNVLNRTDIDWATLLPTDSDFQKPEILKEKLQKIIPIITELGIEGAITTPVIEAFFDTFFAQPIIDTTSALTQFETVVSKVQGGMQANGSWQGSLEDFTNLIASYGEGIDLTKIKFDRLTGQIVLSADAAKILEQNIRDISEAQFDSHLQQMRLNYLTDSSNEANRQAYELAILTNEQFKYRNILKSKELEISKKQAALDKYTAAQDAFISISDKIYAVLTQQVKDAYDEQIQLSKDKVELLNKENEAYDKQLEKIKDIRDIQAEEKNLADLQKKYATLALQGPSEELFNLEQQMVDAGISYRDAKEEQAAKDYKENIDKQITAEEDRQEALQKEMDDFLENYEGMWEQVDKIIAAGWGAVEQVLKSGDDYLKEGQAGRDKMLQDWQMQFATINNSKTKFYNDTSTVLAGIKTSLDLIKQSWSNINTVAASPTSWVVTTKQNIDKLNDSLIDLQNTLTTDALNQLGAMAIAANFTKNPLFQNNSVLPKELQESIFRSELQTAFPINDYDKLSDKDRLALEFIWHSVSDNLKKIMSDYIKNEPAGGYPGYATGGIVPYTGPAMLHGTASQPEAVLNPLQTQAFISLVNSMVAIKGSLSSPSRNGMTGTNPIINIGGVTIEAKSIDSNTDLKDIARRVSDEIARKAYGTLTTTLNPRLGQY